MKRLFGMALMGAIVFGMVWINAQANTPHMANTPDTNTKSKTGKMKWIYRHNVDDPNDLNGSLATMAQLWDVSPSDERPMVRGLLTFWRGMDAAGQYNDKHV